MENQYLSVSQLTKYVSQKFERDPYLQRVFLKGEISNFNRNRPNAHQYFTLKDEKTQLSVVMFRREFQSLRFQPKEGDSVLVVGRVQVYERSGRYQMIIENMQPDGLGQLYIELEETRKKLQEEGLFSQPKKDIPLYPKRIAVVTSPSGAVIRDIIRNIKNRYPIVELVLYPTYVQGDRAAESISGNISEADKKESFDTIIVGRGGGSFEDLFAFNEEQVVRAVAEAETPIITSIGHETDTTLADYAADFRASTPTEAAVHAVPVLEDEILKINSLELRLLNTFRNQLKNRNKRLERLRQSYVFKQPQRLYEKQSQYVDILLDRLLNDMTENISRKNQKIEIIDIKLNNKNPYQNIIGRQTQVDYKEKRLIAQMRSIIKDKHQRTDSAIQSLDLLSPLQTLSRGYSYTMKEDEIIRSVEDVSVGDYITVQMTDGKLQAEIKDIEEEKQND